jgi:O-antigen biosynthesis protein WbqP
MTKRIFDITLGLFLVLLLFIPYLFVFIMVRATSTGPALYWSLRVGRKNKMFKMPKFRTMQLFTPQVATHLLLNGDIYLTPIGSFLRKSSLDEIPQLFSIVKGDMSFVGPRPALFNQEDLIALRSERKIDLIRPGLTGWAQVNGRDDLSNLEKVKFDEEYLAKRNIIFDLKIICLTALQVFRRDGISH